MAGEAAGDFVLGIDLGTNSLGWAMVRLVDGEPAGLIRAGVRVFEAGMEGDLESGREESRNKARRDARLHRRQIWRHRRRLVKLAHILQRAGLLPEGEVTDSEARQDFFNRLDSEILQSPSFAAKEKSGLYHEPRQVMPYILRAAALDERLEPHFLGRALYHLAQRRGFLSNRKQVAKKKDDDEGKVKEGIAELRKAMQENHARTLGEYLSRLAPSAERIRSRWTARDMYEEEFNAIWAAQAKHQPDILTEQRRKELHRAIFYQRPLWFDPNTVGQCELEPGERRAPAYLLVSQRFRLLQTANNLKVLPPDDVERFLTPGDRKKLIDELETKGDRTFKQIFKLLNLEKGYAFNLERGGEKSIKGNRTNADFHKVFGKRWLEMAPEEHDRAVEYVHAFLRPEKLKDAAMRKWNLNEEEAGQLAEISLEPDYMNLSRKAIEKLLPVLERGFPYGSLAPRYGALTPETTDQLIALADEGVPFKEACEKICPESFLSDEPLPVLPPLEVAQDAKKLRQWLEHRKLRSPRPGFTPGMPEIRNPAVMRSLTELRKVVNTILRQYGKPQRIRIELARDLKKSKKQREAISEANRRNEKSRAEAAKTIIAEAGIAQPKPDDLRKSLLAEECHWQCPYTGKSISIHSLFGPEPQFDIEHIIPFSRSMDNSFSNLTLCHIPENRAVKGNKTPFQAYSGDETRYGQIIDRVKKFAGERRMVAAKLKRFMLNDDELELFLEDFRNRQLNDTAYATSLAAKYVGLLYGGVNDAGGVRRVQATSGQTTSYFRNLWKLNAILNDGPTTDGGYKPKSRDDHRHHAVDAVVIGLTDAGMVKRLSDAAQRAPLEHRRRFGSLEAPWPNFVDTVRAEIDKIVVSHRVSKKVSGALHEETIYSRPFPVGAGLKPAPTKSKCGGEDAAGTVVRVRKPLHKLTKPEIEKIADSGVRKLVEAKLAELGGDPKKFADEKNLPRFRSSGVPIKRVRINKTEKTITLGEGRSERHVQTGSNHHVEIYALSDGAGRDKKWHGEVVTMFEAYSRLKSVIPVVQREHGPEVEFRFSLARAEVVECDEKGAGRRLFVVQKISQFSSGRIEIALANPHDARKNKDLLRVGPNGLLKLNARKVVVSPLGEV